MSASNSPSTLASASSNARPLAPLPNLSMLAAVSPSPALSPPGVPSLTAKQWVVPPRPKPGRKPATDTPPTKRKAQNRAAQRAFRERKASKVGELEVQMEEMEKEHEAEVARLTAEMDALSGRLEQSIGAYERDVRDLQTQVDSWRIKYGTLQSGYAEERNARKSLEEELAILRGQAVKLPPRSQPDSKLQGGIQDEGTVIVEPPYQIPESAPFLGCSKCTVLRCQCFEETMNINMDMNGNGNGVSQDLSKRPFSPVSNSAQSSKRFKGGMKQEDQSGASWIYSNLTNRQDSVNVNTSNVNAPAGATPLEPCGFCQDPSTCICAEVAADRLTSMNEAGTLKPSQNGYPTGPDAPATAQNTKSTIPPSSRCSDEPGSCSQCRSDPQSTLFCKSLAAATRQKADATPPPPPPPPQLNIIIPCAAGNACCRVSNALQPCQTGGGLRAPAPAELEMDFTTVSDNRLSRHRGDQQQAPLLSSGTSPTTLSCAEAFTTLSRHPAFNRASQDLGEWLPKLSTTTAAAAGGEDAPSQQHGDIITSSNGMGGGVRADIRRAGNGNGNGTGAGVGHTAFEIEAASVMGVLQFFDRRFGRGD